MRQLLIKAFFFKSLKHGPKRLSSRRKLFFKCRPNVWKNPNFGIYWDYKIYFPEKRWKFLYIIFYHHLTPLILPVLQMIILKTPPYCFSYLFVGFLKFYKILACSSNVSLLSILFSSQCFLHCECSF